MANFQIALESNGLFDLDWKGQKYTWTNRHKDDTFNKLRLDWVVASIDWIEKFGYQNTKVLSSARSNHQPIFVSTVELQSYEGKKTKLFKFEASWIKHDKKEHLIKEI